MKVARVHIAYLEGATSLFIGIKYLFWKGSEYFRHFGRLTSHLTLSPTPVLVLHP
jgi:hypothetical protein